jgi:hypothetical protein
MGIATSLVDRVNEGNVTIQISKYLKTKRVKKMLAEAGYVLALSRYMVAEGTIPRKKGTRCTNILGLNQLSRNTEINPTL